MNISVPNGQDIQEGDYVVISYQHLNTSVLLDSDVRMGDTIIGKLSRTSYNNLNGLARSKAIKTNPEAHNLTLEENASTNSEFHMVFNAAATRLNDIQFSVSVRNDNHSVYSSRLYNVAHSVSVNGAEVASLTGTINGEPLNTLDSANINLSTFRATTNDGENVNGDIFDFGFRQSSNTQPSHVKPGDIITMELAQDSGVAFDISRNPAVGAVTSLNSQELWQNYGSNATANGVLLRTGVDLKYKVIESSSHKLIYQIEQIADERALYQFLPRMTILDTSEQTINYTNNTLNPITATVTISRNGNEYFNRTDTRSGTVIGSNLKNYADIRPRGSVIVRYEDEDGNSLSQEVLLLNKVQQGTQYSAQAVEIEGYEQIGLATNSADKNGSVSEGVKTVIFVYQKKQVAVETPKPVTNTNLDKEITAPNTGVGEGFNIGIFVIIGVVAITLMNVFGFRKQLRIKNIE